MSFLNSDKHFDIPTLHSLLTKILFALYNSFQLFIYLDTQNIDASADKKDISVEKRRKQCQTMSHKNKSCFGLLGRSNAT